MDLIVDDYKSKGCVHSSYGEELIRRFNKAEGKHFLTLEPHLKVFDGLKDLELTGGAESVKEEFEYPTNRDAFDAACKAFHEVYERAMN